MIQAVIFDMDGLMFDTESIYSTVHTNMSTKRSAVFTPKIKNTLMGKRSHEVMEQLNSFWNNNEPIEDLLREQDAELVSLYESEVSTMPGLHTAIHFLNEQRIRKCIGTSSRRFLVDILLRKYDLENEFEFIVSGDEVTSGKPDPEIYTKCVHTLSLPPQACLVLEDSRNGVIAGNEAGCFTCATPSAHTQHEDFSLATLVSKSLSDDRLFDFIA
jgi:HAD superfamily hydrolase (TIGR01509 family)